MLEEEEKGICGEVEKDCLDNKRHTVRVIIPIDQYIFMQLTFNRISGKWYVDLPEWKGSFEDLEMVNGADDLLESLALKLHKGSITFDVWLSKPDTPCGTLKKIGQTLEGATYQVSNCMFYKGTAWLCNVTRFVFGGFHPDQIFFRVA